MKTITYFDLGVWDGQEIDMFIQICEELGAKYTVIGVEADTNQAVLLIDKYWNDPNVHIFNNAISNNGGEKVKLYKSEWNDGQGNSIFPTKTGVNTEKFNLVESIKLSQLFAPVKKCNEIGINVGINILKFNIEGAELYLMEDLLETGIYKNIDLYCGSTPDIEKVEEIKHLLPVYNGMLMKMGIEVKQFYGTMNKEHQEQMQLDMKKEIKILLEK